MAPGITTGCPQRAISRFTWPPPPATRLKPVADPTAKWWEGLSGGGTQVASCLSSRTFPSRTTGSSWKHLVSVGASRAGAEPPTRSLFSQSGTLPADNQETARLWTVDSLAQSPGPVAQKSRTSASPSLSSFAVVSRRWRLRLRPSADLGRVADGSRKRASLGLIETPDS